MNASLVVAPQWIGDAVMSQPLIARLADRGERISVAALPWVAPVYRAVPQVHEVIELPFAHGRLDWSARRALGRSWQGRFDTAYVLPNSIKAALVPFFARIPRRVGYVGESRYVLLNERRANVPGRPPMVAFYSALAGGPPEMPERPRLALPRHAVDQALAAAGVERGGYFAFAPGAEYGPAKRWPAGHYAVLAASLNAMTGLPVALLGSKAEANLCELIAKEAEGACMVLAGKTSLDDAMAVISASRGVVSNDSGLMHVAAAFDIPQVALFGSTSPKHTPPINPRARVIWLKGETDLTCLPCFDRVCRLGHTRCLVDIVPERVAQALSRAMTS